MTPMKTHGPTINSSSSKRTPPSPSCALSQAGPVKVVERPCAKIAWRVAHQETLIHSLNRLVTTVVTYFVRSAKTKMRRGAIPVKRDTKKMSVTVVAMFTTQNQKLLNHQ